MSLNNQVKDAITFHKWRDNYENPMPQVTDSKQAMAVLVKAVIDLDARVDDGLEREAKLEEQIKHLRSKL